MLRWNLLIGSCKRRHPGHDLAKSFSWQDVLSSLVIAQLAAFAVRS
jgi:hypothetical protein